VDEGGIVSESILEPDPGGTKEFLYTGSPQEFVIPKGVKEVMLEVWGASGGVGKNDEIAGNGGYSYGILKVAPNQKLYVYVGQGGIKNSTSATFNGGGRGVSSDNGSGGGATDVRTINGEWNKEVSITSRLIVAGGGGGASGGTGELGGNGGGGNNNGDYGKRNNAKSAAGGGESGCVITPATNPPISAGGGYYNGCSTDPTNYGGGGGGSGYIGGVTNGGGSNGVRSGNGVARICWGKEIETCDGTPPSI
jgi:hypothetical protein